MVKDVAIQISRYLALFVVAVSMVACGEKVMYSDVTSIPENGWPFIDTAKFSVEVEDTTTRFNFFLAVKNSKDYEYSNLILYLKGDGPNGIKSMDTLECFVAYPDGRWTGKSFGSEVSHKFLFKQQAAFPEPGVYTFNFSHAMRDTLLQNITNLGLIIEESQIQ
ncbi:gliding motility lipoprotein GldH [Luteibaculum oceani]|uniref:gliding motility lipoprotein GldH n=1 Tax=Luteibaculum oceani TaxID=1294296 RepID=UPI0014776F9A|nr:gliding motility lipoprotein GldH [Luteibaculum oceani]